MVRRSVFQIMRSVDAIQVSALCLCFGLIVVDNFFSPHFHRLLASFSLMKQMLLDPLGNNGKGTQRRRCINYWLKWMVSSRMRYVKTSWCIPGILSAHCKLVQHVLQGIILMAATNLPDILDPALTRPGRFDRHVSCIYPMWIKSQCVFFSFFGDLMFVNNIWSCS